MRRLSSILLLICFALFHFGYYLFYFSIDLHIEKKWSEKIHSGEHIGSERLMEIPLPVPYLADEEHFKETNTLFEKDGRYFRAIKQRYTNDTFQVIYVPDTAKSSLDLTIRQWVSVIVQDDIPDTTGKTTLPKIFLEDYTKPHNDFVFEWKGKTAENKPSGWIFQHYKNHFLNIITPPPEWV